MLFIGPMDISQSLGYPGDPAHPEVQQVVRQVIDTCSANKKPFGHFLFPPAATPTAALTIR